MKVKMYKKMAALMSAVIMTVTYVSGSVYTSVSADDTESAVIPEAVYDSPGTLSTENADIVSAEAGGGSAAASPETTAVSAAAAVKSFDVDLLTAGMQCSAGDVLDVNLGDKSVINKNTKAALTMESYDGSEAIDTDDLKWIIEDVKGRRSANAGIYNPKSSSAAIVNNRPAVYNLNNVDKTICQRYDISDISKISIGNLKAAGMYNNVVVVRAVNKDYGIKNKDWKTYAAFKIFINPQLPTEWKTLKCKENNIISERSNKSKGILYQLKEEAQSSLYTLEIMEGQSLKLPFVLNNGIDKKIRYTTDSSNFTVINGVVKAVSEADDAGIIYVYSEANPALEPIKVKVKVTSSGNNISVNTNILYMIPGVGKNPGFEQELYVILSKPSAESQNYTIEMPQNSGKYFVSEKIEGQLTFNNNKAVITDADDLAFTVKLRKNEVCTNGDKIIITSDKCSKKLTVDLKPATTFEAVKGYRETLRKVNGETAYNSSDEKEYSVRELNLMYGCSSSLGMYLEPKKGVDNRFELKDVTQEYLPGISDESKGSVAIVNDRIKGTKEGVVYLQAVSSGINNDGKNAKSDVYRINVYKPASSFVWVDPDTVIKGGYLMEKDNALTYCDKSVKGGKLYEIKEPSCGSKEPVTWKVDKPNNLRFSCENGKLYIKVVIGGTYTVTGETKFTKQRFTFRVMANPVESQYDIPLKDSDIVIEYKYKNSNEWIPLSDSSNPVEMSKSNPIQLRVDSNFCGAKLAYKTENADYVTVSAAGAVGVGRHKDGILGENEAVVTVYVLNKKGRLIKDEYGEIMPAEDTELASANITIQPVPDRVIKKPSVTVDKFAEVGANFKVSTKNLGAAKDINWYYITDDPEEPYVSLSTLNGKGIQICGKSGDANVFDEGVYKLLPLSANENINYDEETKMLIVSSDDEENIDYSDRIRTVNIVNNLVTSVSVDLAREEINDLKNTKVEGKGLACGSSKTINIKAKCKVNGKIQDKAPDEGELGNMVWTTTNSNLATAVSVPASEEGAYRAVKITANSNGYTGLVTLTGKTNNGDKTVKIVVYVGK